MTTTVGSAHVSTFEQILDLHTHALTPAGCECSTMSARAAGDWVKRRTERIGMTTTGDKRIFHFCAVLAEIDTRLGISRVTRDHSLDDTNA